MTVTMWLHEFDPFYTYVELEPDFKKEILVGPVRGGLVPVLLGKLKEYLAQEGLSREPIRRPGMRSEKQRMEARIYSWKDPGKNIKPPLWAVLELCEYHGISTNRISKNIIFWASKTHGGKDRDALKVYEPHSIGLNEYTAQLCGLLGSHFIQINKNKQLQLTVNKKKSEAADAYIAWLADEIYSAFTGSFGQIQGGQIESIYKEEERKRPQGIRRDYLLYVPVGLSRNLLRFLHKKLAVEPNTLREELKGLNFITTRALKNHALESRASALEKYRAVESDR